MIHDADGSPGRHIGICTRRGGDSDLIESESRKARIAFERRNLARRPERDRASIREHERSEGIRRAAPTAHDCDHPRGQNYSLHVPPMAGRRSIHLRGNQDARVHRPLTGGARQRGRYALENDERVDVLVARSMTTVESMTVRVEDVWPRRQNVPYARGQSLELPSLDDLIATKLIAARPKDLIDIDFLRALRASRSESNT